MKKNEKLLMCLVISLINPSCNITEDYKHLTPTPEYMILEEAFPDKQKEIVTFQSGFVCEKIDDFYITGGDIILTKDIVNKIDSLQYFSTKSVAISDILQYWPFGYVYYEYAPNVSGNMKNIMEEAMRMWEDAAGLVFCQSTTGNRIYIAHSDNTNSSYLGCVGTGKQELFLSSMSAGVAAHEIGHAIGLIHEHQRYDRNNEIIIKIDNIRREKVHNFRITSSTSSILGTSSIDYNSIMMYPSYNSFAITRTLPTMTRIDGSTWNAQRSYISEGDKKMARFIYGPPYYQVNQAKIRDDSWCSGGVDIVDEEYSNVITFSSDRQGDDLVTTTDPIQVRLKKELRLGNMGNLIGTCQKI